MPPAYTIVTMLRTNEEAYMKTIIRFAHALALLLCLPGLPFAADAASETAAKQVATVFLQALGGTTLDQAVRVSDAPFIMDGTMRSECTSRRA